MIAGWLPITASCLATVEIFRMQGVSMRIVLLVCTLLWLVNNEMLPLSTCGQNFA